MIKLAFEDLVDMFSVALPTENVSDYIRTEYIDLRQGVYAAGNGSEIRLAQLESDPSNKVFAMEFSDKDFRDSFHDGGHGPVRSEGGTYKIVGDHGVFLIRNGDYLVLSQRYGTDVSKMHVMERGSFRSTYRRSYNF